MYSPPALRAIAGALAAAALLYLAFFHLERYPRLFYDEGAYLQVAKNIALHGLYAESSDGGPRFYGGPVGVGPTMHLPIALTFYLLGAGVVQGRLVVTLYLLACVGVFHALARHLGDSVLAWIATALLVTVPALSLVPLGRQAMGEVPGLFFVLCALLVWFRRWERHTLGSLVAVGALFGLGAVTKNQFALVLDLSLAACAASNAFYYRLAAHRVFVVPLLLTIACHTAWSGLFFMLVPAAGRADILACGPPIAAVTTLLVPSPTRVAQAVRALLRPGVYFGLLLPALAYAAYRGRERTVEEQHWSVIFTLALVNFSWFTLLTVGWMRYAFLGLALSSLLVARLLRILLGDLRRPTPSETAAPQARRRRWLGRAVIAWAAAGVTLSAARLMLDVTSPPPPAASQMAEYLRAHVPLDAVIDTWEPEMGFLSDHRFRLPPCRLMADAIAHTTYGTPPPWASYDPLRDSPPRYLLAGEFSVFVAGYRFDEVERSYRVVQRFGVYTLYERVAAP